MRVAHVVVTNAFAGAERDDCDVADEQGACGHVVHVVGEGSTRMRDLLRRSHAIDLVEMAVETVQLVGAMSQPPRGIDLRPGLSSSLTPLGTQRGRFAQADGNLSFVARPNDARLGRDSSVGSRASRS